MSLRYAHGDRTTASPCVSAAQNATADLNGYAAPEGIIGAYRRKFSVLAVQGHAHTCLYAQRHSSSAALYNLALCRRTSAMRVYPPLVVYARCWYVFKTTMMVFYQNMGSRAKMVVKAVSVSGTEFIPIPFKFDL